MKRNTRMISALMAALLALTMTACGNGGSSPKDPADSSAGNAAGTAETAQAGDCVYSAQQIEINDTDGIMSDLNVENMVYRDGRLYLAGYSYGFSESGNHIMLNFAPDGSDLQYSMLMGAGTEDVLSVNIGADGNYYVAKVSYDSGSMGFSSPESASGNPQEGPAGAEGPAGEAAEGPAGEAAEETIVSEGPVEEGKNPGPEPQVEEFFTEDGDSPANDPALVEESTNGITSPADEAAANADAQAMDAEEELVVSEAAETDPASMASQDQTGESTFVLSCIAPDGNELWTAPAKVPEDAGMDYYLSSVSYCSEGLLVSNSQGLDLYSAQDGSYIRSVSTDEAVRNVTPYVLEDGTVAILTYGNRGEEVAAVNLETGEVGETYPIPSEVGLSFMFPGKTYQLYLSGANAVYGMNLDGSGVVKVIDFVDSDMDISAVTCLSEMEDGKLAAVISDQTGSGKVEILTKVDPEVVKSRKTITLGSYYLDYDVRRQVFAFNKENQDVRISIVDYSQYDGETGTEGLTRLNTDIASGSAPDILVLSAVMPIKSYISKGVFEDLTPYMEQDEEISQKEYLTNVFDAFKTEGRTYAVIPSFYVNAIAGKTADIGDGSGLTLDLCDQLTAQKGIAPAMTFGIATRDDILYQAMELCGDQFIDWDKSECRFDSPEFIRLLEFIAQFPAKIDDNSMQEDTTALYRNGKALLARQSIGSFDEYVNLRYGTFGEEITLAGFPSQTPGTAAISPQLEIAVNASSKEKDACWKFVRRFLLDDYQNAIEMYWPVSISALDQMANEAMEPLYYIDENGNKVEDHIVVSIGGENIQLPRISDAEVDQIYAFLKGLNSSAYFDSSVENIIVEESAAFFEGQKSAKDVAGVIQSRVQIYINENS